VVQRSVGRISKVSGPDSGDGGSFIVYWKEDL
jgi:hypothetical protein